MPSWKKVITSGSDAALQSLTVSTTITANSFKTPTGSSTQFLMADGSVDTYGTTAGTVAEGNRDGQYLTNNVVQCSTITYSFFDYMYAGEPCSPSSLYYEVYLGSDGKYYVKTRNYILISAISSTWYQYAYHDNNTGVYIYNKYTSFNGDLTYYGNESSNCSPF